MKHTEAVTRNSGTVIPNNLIYHEYYTVAEDERLRSGREKSCYSTNERQVPILPHLDIRSSTVHETLFHDSRALDGGVVLVRAGTFWISDIVLALERRIHSVNARIRKTQYV